MIKKSYNGIGKRKTSVANVHLQEGEGKIIINKKKVEDFISGSIEEIEIIKTPLLLTNSNNKYDIFVTVNGGGISSQLEAIRLAIAKALLTINSEYRKSLNESSLLTRDARIKERRKYGLRKARKAPQYSKR
jgi:small subunit ribosomal protein S9